MLLVGLPDECSRCIPCSSIAAVKLLAAATERAEGVLVVEPREEHRQIDQGDPLIRRPVTRRRRSGHAAGSCPSCPSGPGLAGA